MALGDAMMRAGIAETRILREERMSKKDGEKAVDQFNQRVGRASRLRAYAAVWSEQPSTEFRALAELARELADFVDGK